MKPSKAHKKNLLASKFALASGILLILSGTTGVNNVLNIREKLAFLDFHLVNKLFGVLLFIAGLGGLAVIFGGYLILKNKIIPGRIVIMLGSGIGFITFLINIFTLFMTKAFQIGLFTSFGFIAIILAVVAQTLCVKEDEKYIKKYKK